MNLSDLISDEDVDKRIEVQERIDDLSRIERAMLHLWVEGYTQAEIGVVFGYSQSQVSRILKNLCKE
jgi:DNA-directed RNA polymerase specialized sigma subunit